MRGCQFRAPVICNVMRIKSIVFIPSCRKRIDCLLKYRLRPALLLIAGEGVQKSGNFRFVGASRNDLADFERSQRSGHNIQHFPKRFHRIRFDYAPIFVRFQVHNEAFSEKQNFAAIPRQPLAVRRINPSVRAF